MVFLKSLKLPHPLLYKDTLRKIWEAENASVRWMAGKHTAVPLRCVHLLKAWLKRTSQKQRQVETQDYLQCKSSDSEISIVVLGILWMLLLFLFAAMPSRCSPYSWKARVDCTLHSSRAFMDFHVSFMDLHSAMTFIVQLCSSSGDDKAAFKKPSALELLVTILNISVTWFTAWPQNQP